MKRPHRLTYAIACAVTLAMCFSLANAETTTSEHPAHSDVPSNSTPAAAVFEGQLEFFDQTSSSADIDGQYTSAGSVVLFHVESWTAGTPSAVGAIPDKVTIRLEVNGAPIDHEFDYGTQTVTIDGYGTTLYGDDVQVFRSFYPMLEKSLYESVMTEKNMVARDVTAQDALLRLATMYSEAPVGVVLRQRTVGPPAEDTGRAERDRAPVIGSEPFSEPSKEEVMAAACQVNGADGITDLYRPCSALRYRYTFHDADNHCYWSTYEAYGENSDNCKGRCGVGCGVLGGRGNWTVDCHDHDWCSTYHNSGCGDEWREAADDYLRGGGRC